MAAPTTDLYYSTAMASRGRNSKAASPPRNTRLEAAGAGYIDALSRSAIPSPVALSFQRVYALQDANYNVTALVSYNTGTSTWTIAQRQVYDSYGKFIILTGGFTSTTDSFGWQYNRQGLCGLNVLIGWYNDRACV